MKRRKFAAFVLLAATALGISGCSATPSPPPAIAPMPAPAYRQSMLPFTDLESPRDLAVDAVGNVYVADLHRSEDTAGHPYVTTRVIKLPAGSNTPTVLPQFVHADLVADAAGAVWVIDAAKEQLVKLEAGSGAQTVLPLSDLGLRGEVLAVDTAGTAYGSDGGGVYPDGGCCVPIRVVKSEAGSHAPTVLPFTHILGLGGMAVDAAGNVYAGDFKRVLKLGARADTQTVLPFELGSVAGVAVDSAGSVYVLDAERKQVLKLAAGADKPIVLPFTGLNQPASVAVDAAGSVYITDVGNRSVLKLSA